MLLDFEWQFNGNFLNINEHWSHARRPRGKALSTGSITIHFQFTDKDQWHSRHSFQTTLNLNSFPGGLLPLMSTVPFNLDQIICVSW